MNKLEIYKRGIINKLSRFKNMVYRKELGVILSYNLDETDKDNYCNKKHKSDRQATFRKSLNVKEVIPFFKKMGKHDINLDTVKRWLKQGNDCWLVYDRNNVIGGTWILKGKMTITQLTEHWLSKDKTVTFDKDSVYQCYTIIDKNYRGQGIYQRLNQCLLKYYSNISSINKMLLITRASNAAMITIAMENGGKLIGIVEVKNILGRVYRKEIFLNEKEKKWT